MTGSDNVCNVNQIKDLRDFDSRISCPNSQQDSEADPPAVRACRGCLQPFPVIDKRRHFCSDKCQRETFSASLRRRQAEHRAKFPDRIVARQTLKNAILLGKVRRCSRCEECGEKTFTEGHHGDYAKPYYVTWLCRACHASLEDGQHFGCGREKHADTVGLDMAERPSKRVGGRL
jgi:hypothetical protein